MNKLIVIVCFLVIVVASCRRQPTDTHYPIDADLKAAFDFKIGSYWIYQDSLTGDMDSFVVTTRQTYLNMKYDDNRFYDETFSQVVEYQIKPTIDSINCWYFSLSMNLIGLECPNSKCSCSGSPDLFYLPLTDYPFHNPTRFMNFDPFGTGGCGGSKTVELYNSETVLGNTYSSAAKVNFAFSHTAQQNYPLSNPFSINNTFYITPNVGIIQIDLNQPDDPLYRVWQLVRYHVVL